MRTTCKVMIIGITLLVAFSAPSAVAQDKKIELRIGHANAPLDDSIFHVVSVTFKENVEKLSGGKDSGQNLSFGAARERRRDGESDHDGRSRCLFHQPEPHHQLFPTS